MMGGGKDDAILGAKRVEKSDGESGSFFGGGARAHFIGHNQRMRCGSVEHAFQVENVRRECGKIGGDRLFIPDVYQDLIEEGKNGALGGNGNSGLRGESS